VIDLPHFGPLGDSRADPARPSTSWQSMCKTYCPQLRVPDNRQSLPVRLIVVFFDERVGGDRIQLFARHRAPTKRNAGHNLCAGPPAPYPSTSLLKPQCTQSYPTCADRADEAHRAVSVLCKLKKNKAVRSNRVLSRPPLLGHGTRQTTLGIFSRADESL
jgi:hypothetical protein